MAVGHAENVIGLLDQIGREHAAALLGNIDAQLLEGAHGMGAGRLALHGAHAGGNSLEIRPALRGVAKKALGHRTAADIARANEKNGPHSWNRVNVAVCHENRQPRKSAACAGAHPVSCLALPNPTFSTGGGMTA